MTLEEKKAQIVENYTRVMEVNPDLDHFKHMLTLSLMVIEKLGDTVTGIMSGPQYKMDNGTILEAKTRRLNTQLVVKPDDLDDLDDSELKELLESTSNRIAQEFIPEFDSCGENFQFWMYEPVTSTGMVILPKTRKRIYAFMTRYATWLPRHTLKLIPGGKEKE